MPPERSQQLVYELDAWYRASRMRQKDLAGALRLSPKQLAEILAGRNRPTADQALLILDFLNAQTMKPELVDPPAMPRPSTRDPNEPKTLLEAKEMLTALRAELASTKTTAGTSGIPTPAPATKPPAPIAETAPGGPSISPTPEIQLADMSSDELRVVLQSEKDPNLKFAIYQELNARENPGVLNGRTPGGMTLVSTAELNRLQHKIDESRRKRELRATAAASSSETKRQHTLEGQLAAINATKDAARALGSRPIDSLNLAELRSLLGVTEDHDKRAELYNRIKRAEKARRLEWPR